jgi:ribosomal protein S18 acetylase RimI-like enzyme
VDIEKLTGKEIGQIKELWEELNALHKTLSGRFKNHFANFTFEERLEKLTSKNRLAVFLAKDKGIKVGYCIATTQQSNGEIDSIYIRPAFQGQGIGSKLISEAVLWLKDNGCKDISVYIAEGNEAVKEFYRRFDFNERFTVMQKRIT